MKNYAGPLQTDLRPDPDQILRQATFWFGEQMAGEIDLGWYKPGTGELNQFQRFRLDELEELAEFACEVNRVPGQSLYMRPALVQPDAPKFVTDLNFLRTPGIWADLDEPGTADNARTILPMTRPNMVVVTGRHPHVRAQLFWRLSDPIGDPAQLRDLNKRARDLFRGDPLVVNPTSLMRVAGTIAWPWKPGRQIEMTELRLFDDRPQSYPVLAIERTLPKQETVSAAPEQEAYDRAGDGLFDGISVPRLIAKIRRGEGGWHDDVLRLVAHLVNHGRTDEEILTLSEALTLPGYTVPQTRHDVAQMVRGARVKWDIPEPETAIEKPAEPKGDLPVLWYDDIEGSADPADFVEGLLCEAAMSVVYGESNCGKTFFISDLALHVALGWEWRGREVEQGGVIYCALEGAAGIKNRILAFKKKHGVLAGVPFGVVPTAINLLDPKADTDRLIELIRAAAEKVGQPIRLIVIDTLSRALAGGNENAPDDMGALVMNADKIRQATGAHLCFVHHSGKDAAKGARGHSLLRAATDTEIEVSRDQDAGISTATVTKQRELSIDGTFSFSLETIEIGRNRRDKPVTSCVVTPEGDRPKSVKLTDTEMRALERLRAIMPENGKIVTPSVTIGTVTAAQISAWRDDLKDWDVTDRDNPANARQQFKRIRDGLVKKGKIGVFKEEVWLA